MDIIKIGNIRKNDIIKNKWAREKEDIYLFYYSELNKITYFL